MPSRGARFGSGGRQQAMSMLSATSGRISSHTQGTRLSLLERSLVALLCVWAVGSTILGRSFTALGWRSSWDGIYYAYFGLQWLHGRIPYQQMWENKPPGLFALNAAVFSVFPGSFTALAVVEGLSILGCAATVYFLMRRWGAPRLAAYLAAGATAVASNLNAFSGSGNSGNLTELYVLWPAVLSMYFFTRFGERFGSWSVLAAGFFSGVAFLFKTVGLAPLLAQCAFLLFLTFFRRIRVGRTFYLSAIDLMGASLAILPFAIYFWQHHAISESISASVTYNVWYGYSSFPSLVREPFIVAARLAPVGSLVACFLAGLSWFLIGKWRSRSLQNEGKSKFDFFGPLTLLWILADLCGALAGGRNYTHYFLCLIPSLSVGAGLAYWFITEMIYTEALGTTSNLLILALVLGPLLLPQAQDVLTLRDVQLNKTTWFGVVNSEQDAATYLRRIEKPGDTLYMWNFLPLIYFETEMPSPTRLPDAHYRWDSKYSNEKLVPEMLSELEDSPPTFIVDATTNPDPGDPVYPVFYKFVQKEYDLRYEVNVPDDPAKKALSLGNDIRVYQRTSGAKVH
jgi:Dolichyl-phosphate-mannose-protein mannosyltransferase